MKRSFLIALFLGVMAGSALGQMPPAKWWRRPDIVSNLALTDDQQNRLDAIFRSAANDLIDARAAVEKETIALRGELDQPQLNRASIEKVAARLNEARGRLFEHELAMLVDMRGVLSEQQWNRMRSQLDMMGMQKNERPNAQRRQMRQRP